MSQEAPIEEPVVETPTPPAVDKYLDDMRNFCNLVEDFSEYIATHR